MRPKQKPNEFPHLATLDDVPSWLNARGFIDRSACIEIRVSEIRRLAGCVKIDRTQRDSRGRHLHLTFPLPNEKPARKKFADGSQRISTGVITITARQLHILHQRRMPRLLAGDFRTSRANVMSANGDHDPNIHRRDRRERGETYWVEPQTNTDDLRNQSAIVNAKSSTPNLSSASSANSAVKFRSRITRAQPIAWPPDRGLSVNPNKGAARSKIIGLTADWSQPIRIEKWIYPNRIRPVYFMICPGSSATRHQGKRHQGIKENNSMPQSAKASMLNSLMPRSLDASMPPLSTRRPGRLDPFKSGGSCPQRCLKLLMVQCTKAEARDADLAQLWIDSLPRGGRLRLREPYKSFINKLLTRYGLIMFPRVLLCPRCLKVRYGNNPETVRQGWRRRNNKPDTSRAGNAHRLAELTPLTHWSRYNLAFAEMAMNEGKRRNSKRRNGERRTGMKTNSGESNFKECRRRGMAMPRLWGV